MSWFFASGGQSIGVSASSISPFNEYSGLISFRMDWLDLLAVQVFSNTTVQKHPFFGAQISLEGMMLKLKLQYFGHLMRRVDSLEKTLMLGGIGGRKRRG